MSHLPFRSYEKSGAAHTRDYGYAQSVRVGDIVYISGQGGWSSEDPTVFGKDQLEQIDWAFRNIELALKDSGALMKDVFKVVSYHKSLNEQSFERTVDNFKRYMPNHKPLWTCVQVENLAVDKMEVEIEVIACCPT